MFGIGGFELFLILLFGVLIFGPDKLPAMAKTLGAMEGACAWAVASRDKERAEAFARTYGVERA